jgi:geranylgeranylglycerol-phosphate geranylgeranyltransferase
MLRLAGIWLWNHVEITRPHNLVVAALTVLAGWWATGSGVALPLVAACLASVLVAAAGNVVNDCFDAAIDRINKPQRPIPSGRMTVRESRTYAAALALLALACAALAGPLMVTVTLAWSLALLLYSARLKTRFLWGNLTVSLVCASGFPVGAALAGDVRPGLLPAVLAFCFLMGREIVKDVEDLRGDGAAGATTLARRLGASRALQVALLFFLAFALLLPWPYWTAQVNARYLMIMLAGALPLLGWASWSMLRDSSPRNLVRVSWILKIDMFVGVLGFWFGLVR